MSYQRRHRLYGWRKRRVWEKRYAKQVKTAKRQAKRYLRGYLQHEHPQLVQAMGIEWVLKRRRRLRGGGEEPLEAYFQHRLTAVRE